MKAIMLAAGEGSRCRPFTYLYPKFTQQVCGIPILEYMLSWFSEMPEIERLYLVMNQGFEMDSVQKYIERRSFYIGDILRLFADLGYKVRYDNPTLEIEIVPAKRWGTGGDLRLALDEINSKEALTEDFIICNADYITIRKLADGALTPQIGLKDIVAYHRNCKKALQTVMTMALIPVKREEATRFGVVQTGRKKGLRYVTSFKEKPAIEDVTRRPLVNAGVYVIDNSFILSNLDKHLPRQAGTSLEKTLLSPLATAKDARLAACVLNLQQWFDIGTLKQLVATNVYVAGQGKASLKRVSRER